MLLIMSGFWTIYRLNFADLFADLFADVLEHFICPKWGQ